MNSVPPKCSPFDQKQTYRILGIDPGSSHLGVAVLEVEVSTGRVALVWVETLKGQRFIKRYPELVDLHGERFTRLYGYRARLIDTFNNWQPDTVACEANFMGRFPTAYAALTESVLMIRLAVMDYRLDMELPIIEPSVVKTVMGVKGNSGDKNAIAKAVKKLPIEFHQPQILDGLDEHSTDAIAVAYWRYRNIFHG